MTWTPDWRVPPLGFEPTPSLVKYKEDLARFVEAACQDSDPPRALAALNLLLDHGRLDDVVDHLADLLIDFATSGATPGSVGACPARRVVRRRLLSRARAT